MAITGSLRNIIAACTCGSVSCGRVKITAIGWICVTLTIPVASLAWIRLPGSTSRNPVRPSIGEAMDAKSRLSLAVAIAASSPWMFACDWVTLACCVSTCCREAKSLRARLA